MMGPTNSPDSSQPETPAYRLVRERFEVTKRPQEGLALLSHEIPHREHYLERRVESEEGLQQIGLGPEMPYPRSRRIRRRVVPWKRNIVNVHQYPWSKPRQDLQEEEVDVPSNAHRVARVYEKDVASRKRIEPMRIEELDRRICQLRRDASVLGEGWRRIGVNDTVSCGGAGLHGVRRQSLVDDNGRLARADLDHETGLESANHAVRTRCAAEAEGAVLGIEVRRARIYRTSGWPSTLMTERLTYRGKQLKLIVAIEGHAGQLASRIPYAPPSEVLHIGYRRVEVDRHRQEPESKTRGRADPATRGGRDNRSSRSNCHAQQPLAQSCTGATHISTQYGCARRLHRRTLKQAEGWTRTESWRPSARRNQRCLLRTNPDVTIAPPGVHPRRSCRHDCRARASRIKAASIPAIAQRRTQRQPCGRAPS